MTKLRIMCAAMAAASMLACGGGPTRGGKDAGSDAGPGAAVDAGQQLPPHAGIAQVAGGAAMTSPSYRLVTTTGQGTADNATMSSRGYVMVGGIVGATQAR